MQNLNSKPKKFWRNRKVFITGHTGFKGSWLCLWLNLLGAKITGYALQPPTSPNLFELAKVEEVVNSIIADVRNLDSLKKAMTEAQPDVVIHMAAQPLVRESYKVPVETFETNVMGTVNLLEAVRSCPSVKSVVVVTTDKVYKNPDTNKQSFGEEDALGGYDPYSSSKASAELAANAYYCSYFKDKIALATARAGNVIGGGDFAVDRLVPDFVRSIIDNKPIKVRNPKAVRPWQHVLEPLSGYMLLAQKGCEGAWNFGPDKKDVKTVEWLTKKLCDLWASGASCQIDQSKHPHEAHYLELDSRKARKELGWQPKWGLEQSLGKVVEWTKAYLAKDDVREVCVNQIKEYALTPINTMSPPPLPEGEGDPSWEKEKGIPSPFGRGDYRGEG